MLEKVLPALIAYQLLVDFEDYDIKDGKTGKLMKDSSTDLQPSEWQSILQPVFPVLLRVGVQQHIIHLTTDRDNSQ